MKQTEFEQAKREFAEKWGYTVEFGEWHEDDERGQILSDLTALLEQHKEVIAADMYPKEFVEWKEVANVLILPPNERYKEGRRYRMDVVGEDYKKVYHLTFYGIDELFNYWLKNMKK